MSKPGDTIAASGGRLAVDLATLSGCGWTATSDAPWLTLVSGAGGNASGTITVEAAANGGDARVAHVNAGGQTYTVQQAAAATTPSPSPSPAPSPSPTPTPSPTPPPSPSITLEGVAFAVLGRCPDIGFFTDGHWTVADASTDYKKGRCADVSSGDTVKVTGRLRQDGVVQADSIELKKQQR